MTHLLKEQMINGLDKVQNVLHAHPFFFHPFCAIQTYKMIVMIKAMTKMIGNCSNATSRLLRCKIDGKKTTAMTNPAIMQMHTKMRRRFNGIKERITASIDKEATTKYKVIGHCS